MFGFPHLSVRASSGPHVLAYISLDRICVPIPDPLFHLHFLRVFNQIKGSHATQGCPDNVIGPAKQVHLVPGAKTASPLTLAC
jgi:hypothetical protein